MARRKSKKSSPLGCLVFVVIIFLALIGSSGSKEDKQATKSTSYSTAKTVVSSAVSVTPVSSPTASPTPTPQPTATPKNERTYIYNKNTKKFHEEYCSSVEDMKPKNRGEFTGTREEMIQKGYDPCGRCKP